MEVIGMPMPNLPVTKVVMEVIGVGFPKASVSQVKMEIIGASPLPYQTPGHTEVWWSS
jgi:hypothetical protein